MSGDPDGRGALQAGASAEALFELSRDLLCTLTLDGRFSRVSESCERLTGFRPHELLGHPLLAFVHPLDRAQAERAFGHALDRGHVDEVPTRFRTASGGHVSLRWGAVADREGDCVYTVARPMRRERERSGRRRARAALKAAAAERARLTADLHDGLLQSLTGASLKLETASRLLDTDRAAALNMLQSVASLLYEEQRELRFLVEEMKGGWSERRASAPASLGDRLTAFARRLHATWDIELFSFLAGAGTLPEKLVRPLFGIVHEAVVNAARHGGARAATVRIGVERDHATVHVSDNGRGLSFTGHLDDAALRAGAQGPAVLMHRVWSLGGRLAIDSRPEGVSVAIYIPFEEDS